SGQDHSLRFQSAHLPGREVGDDDHLAAYKFFRLVILGDAGQDLARLVLCLGNREPQPLRRFWYALGRQNLAAVQLFFRQNVIGVVGWRGRGLADGLGRHLGRSLTRLFFAIFSSRDLARRFFLFDFVHNFLFVQFGEDWFDFADALACGLSPPQRVRRNFGHF